VEFPFVMNGTWLRRYFGGDAKQFTVSGTDHKIETAA